MKIKLTKKQIKLLDAEAKIYRAFWKAQDRRLAALAKEFGLPNDDIIFDYVANGSSWMIEETD